jgi:ATP-dependent DNA ligase
MLAKLTRELPPSGAVSYEPKWDGFRCIVFRDGDDLDLQSRNQKPLLRYFPELREPLLDQLPDRVVLDGELVVANERGLDFDALQLRQHPAASRVNKLAIEIPASYVAFDLLALDDESLLDTPFEGRRAALERVFAKVRPPLYLTPTTREREVLRLIARGYAYKEVARDLGISVKTVETHVSSVLRKLQLSSRHQLARWASDRRLI